MKIFVGSDHRGFNLKQAIVPWLKEQGYSVIDVGDKKLDPDDDYPQFAQKACLELLGAPSLDSRAILICGGGQGMAMASNRFKGIRASVIRSSGEARATRIDNDSNVLCLPDDVLEGDMNNVHTIIQTWLETKFSGAARHTRRINELDNF